MYRRILVATDGSELADAALAQGAALAKTAGAELFIVTVTEGPPVIAQGEAGWSVPGEVFDEIARRKTETAARILAHATELARTAGVASRTVHIEDRYPAEGIIECATDTRADLIVMASHGRRGIQRLLLGSQAREVLTASPVPVLVVRGETAGFGTIVAATDGSELGGKAVAAAADLAQLEGARLVLLNVSEAWTGIGMASTARWSGGFSPIAGYEAAQERASAEILTAARALAGAAEPNIETRHEVSQGVAEGILECAREEGAGLIVMASHGRRGIRRAVLGSQAAEVLAHADRPVLIVK